MVLSVVVVVVVLQVVRECLVGRNAVGPFVFGRVIGTQVSQSE